MIFLGLQFVTNHSGPQELMSLLVTISSCPEWLMCICREGGGDMERQPDRLLGAMDQWIRPYTIIATYRYASLWESKKNTKTHETTALDYQSIISV